MMAYTVTNKQFINKASQYVFFSNICSIILNIISSIYFEYKSNSGA